MNRMYVVSIAVTVVLLFSSNVGAQDKVDLNDYYKFPVSFGFQYQSITPLGDLRSRFDVFDINGNVKVPLPFKPTVQPVTQLGLTQFTGRAGDESWSHNDLYAMVGLGYANRFTKEFELGIDIQSGLALSLFPQLLPELGTVAALNWTSQLGTRLGINPSYGFSLEVNPSLKYNKSLNPLKDFDGLSLGLGVSVNFRLGEDPDSAKAELRSLRFEQKNRISVFPAMQSWYVTNPLTSVTIKNTETFPLEDLEISFYQNRFMDGPTPCLTIPLLGPGESKEVPILASFNEEVFRNEGVSPMTGEVKVNYRGRGRNAEQTMSLSYDLQDKSAIVWDDDRKASAFITASDSALRNYASSIRQNFRSEVIPGMSPELQYALQLFYSLGEIGILYQSDPLQPFAQMSSGTVLIDSISLPRDTLRRGTGDCDDLSVLFSAMLEAAGIESALITVPGHIYVAINTKVPSRQFSELHPDRSMTIPVGDELWVPVEITLIGLSTFNDAWKKGIDEWRAAELDPTQRGFYPIRQAQAVYRPVGLRETDLGLQYGKVEPILAKVRRDIGVYVDTLLGPLQAAVRENATKESLNRLGVRQAKLGRGEAALQTFRLAMAKDPNYPSPVLNSANIYFQAKDYARALVEYQKAEGLMGQVLGTPAGVALYLNMAACYSAQGNLNLSTAYVAKVALVDEVAARNFTNISPVTSNDGNRASQASSTTWDVLYLE